MVILGITLLADAQHGICSCIADVRHFHSVDSSNKYIYCIISKCIFFVFEKPLKDFTFVFEPDVLDGPSTPTTDQ